MKQSVSALVHNPLDVAAEKLLVPAALSVLRACARRRNIRNNAGAMSSAVVDLSDKLMQPSQTTVRSFAQSWTLIPEQSQSSSSKVVAPGKMGGHRKPVLEPHRTSGGSRPIKKNTCPQAILELRSICETAAPGELN